jgi:hypothetical protein
VWEARWFASAFPARLSPERLAELFGPPVGPIVDDDVYLLWPAGRSNVKVRRRTGTVKLKALVERLGDGFELWRTEVDSTLPAPRWAAELLAAEVPGGDAAAATSDVDELLVRLCDGGGVRCVTVTKSRAFFDEGDARIEMASVRLGRDPVVSLAVESPDLAKARSAQAMLRADDLGATESYWERLRAYARLHD